MSAICRFANSFHKISHILYQNQRQNINKHVNKRLFHFTPILGLREVVETTEGNVTVVEGRIIDSPRKDYMAKLESPIGDGHKHVCALCRLNTEIKYTDVLIISQFVQEDGEIVPRQITGLCYPQHVRMRDLVHRAHRAGLMQNLKPHVYPDEYSQMSDHAWKKYNTYFTESVDE